MFVFKYFLLLSLAIVLFFQSSAQFSIAQEMDARVYTQIISKGEMKEKLTAAQEITKLNLIDRRLERALYRELRRGKILENDLIFLRAYLSVISDPKKESKAYKEFTDNVYSRKWPTGVSPAREQLDQMMQLIKVVPLTEELIIFFENEKSSRKLNATTRAYLLQQMAVVHPKMIEIIIDRLPNDVENNLNMLVAVPADRIQPYVDKIRSVASIAPANALHLLQKADFITEAEIEIALEHAAPLESMQYFTGSKGANVVSTEVLMANFHLNEMAKEKIFELFTEGNIDLVMQSYRSQPIKTPEADSKFQDYLVSKLTNTDQNLNQLRSNLCLYLQGFKSLKAESLGAIWQLAVDGESSIERASCSFALTKQETINSDYVEFYLGILDIDFDSVVEKLENYHETADPSGSFLQVGAIESVIYVSDDGPELALLFKAYLMLKAGYKTELAMEIVDRFEAADVNFVRNNQFEMYNMGNKFKPAASYRIQGSKDEVTYILELTPTDIRSMVKYKENIAEWEDFILEKLVSRDEQESLNAIFIINEYEQELPEQFLEPLLEKARDKKYYYRHFYVEGLKHLAHFESASNYLDEILSSSDKVFANFVAGFWPIEDNQVQ